MGSAATCLVIYRMQQKLLQQVENESEDGLKKGMMGLRGSSQQRSALFQSMRATDIATGMDQNASAYTAMMNQNNSGLLLNDLVSRLWPHINKAIAQIIRETVEPTFATSLPGPLAKLHFTKLDLGSVPIGLDNFTVHDEAADGSLKFEMDVVWDGDCHIELAFDLGSMGVKSLKLFGRLSVVFKPLMDTVPIVGAIQYAFVNPPEIELDFTGLANVADFSGVSGTVRSIIVDCLSIMVLPNRMMVKMDPVATEQFETIYQPPMGMARVTLGHGRGFIVEKRTFGKDDVPDIYCYVSLGNKTWKSSTVDDCLEPVWNETADYLLSDYDQIITVHAWDLDGGPLDPDDDLGQTKFRVGDLILSGKPVERELVMKDGKGTGAMISLSCQLLPFTNNLATIQDPQIAAPPPPATVAPAEAKRSWRKKPPTKPATEDATYCGLLTIMVYRAYDLPLEKEGASSFVKVLFGESGGIPNVSVFEFVTSTIETCASAGIDGLNPMYDACFHVPLTPALVKSDCDVMLTLMSKEKSLGIVTGSLSSIIMSKDATIKTVGKVGDKNALLSYKLTVSGLEVRLPSFSAALGGSGSSDNRSLEVVSTSGTRSLGSAVDINSKSTGGGGGTLVRITAIEGHGFEVRKRRFLRDDVPDVYCKIKLGSNPEIWRTKTIKDSHDPVWNESKDFAVFGGESEIYGQTIQLDVFDENKKSKDTYLGNARVQVGKVLLAGGRMKLPILDTGKSTEKVVILECELIQS